MVTGPMRRMTPPRIHLRLEVGRRGEDSGRCPAHPAFFSKHLVCAMDVVFGTITKGDEEKVFIGYIPENDQELEDLLDDALDENAEDRASPSETSSPEAEVS